jgi:hypothetical protein
MRERERREGEGDPERERESLRGMREGEGEREFFLYVHRIIQESVRYDHPLPPALDE